VPSLAFIWAYVAAASNGALRKEEIRSMRSKIASSEINK